MAEEYKEVIDYKKIATVAGMIIFVTIIAISYFFNLLPMVLNDITVNNHNLNQETKSTVTEKSDQIKPEYEKYIDLGLSYDDILDFQEMPCSTFDTPEMISTDSKYISIIEQRKIECNL